MKQDLNGKYCFTNEENYKQLVKDGCFSAVGFNNRSDFMIIIDNFICFNDAIYGGEFTKMHYNKEKECWEFGE